MSPDRSVAVIAVGAGRYADPFHPFAETGAAVAEILAGDGFETAVVTDVDAALTELEGVDLLVVCAGDPWRNGDVGFGAPAASVAGLEAALERGIGVLGIHAAASSLRDYAAWPAALGALWLPGVSFHPEFGQAAVEVLAHSLTDGIDSFELLDERYSRLQAIGDSVVLAEHENEGERHPLIWIRSHGSSRVACDLLGHDARSFSSEPHRELLRRLARWAARA